MPTQLTVINEALNLLGEPNVSDPNQNNSWVRKIRNAEPHQVGVLLEDYEWNFARRVVLLNASGVAKIGWNYAYPIPNDCLRIDHVSPDPKTDSEQCPYEPREGHICTNEKEVYLTYQTSDVTESYGSWSNKFANLLAAEIANAIVPTTDDRGATYDRINAALIKRRRDAKAHDSMQRGRRIPPLSKWQAVRAGSGRYGIGSGGSR